MSAIRPDPDETLPGEDPTSTYLDDAIHWINVYSELLGVKAALLDRADEAIEGASPEAAHEVGFDRDFLEAQARRYAVRLHYWRRRARELSSG